ncbi:PPPDE putative peptidase domain-containing protein [Helicostylum pulchrum]|nr:PPPDE putative peptidase domain-containing protein [Helicostylum pulchrum]
MLNLISKVFSKAEISKEQEQRKIVLNVYDMLQPGFITNFGYAMGIGIYHSGIEIGEHEYCFGGHDYEHVTGVFMVQPKIGPQGPLFKQSLHMGYTNLSKKQVDKVLQEISKEYIGTSYNLLTRNCNHFSEDLCKRLTGKTAPGWINRAAKLGTMFPCVIPTEWVEPPDAQTGSERTESPSSSCSSNTPLKKPTATKKKRHSESTESIRLARTAVMEDDEIDCSSPVKEPDTYRPEVIRSATRLSITAPITF